MPKRTSAGVSRRAVVSGGVSGAVAGIPLFPLSSLIAAAPAAPFTPLQNRLIEAVTDRLIPRDENGPGAIEAGVPVYFRRSFSGPLSASAKAFAQALDQLDAATRARHNKSFPDLSPAQQDEFLAALEANEITGILPDSRSLFNRFRQLTLEGMFGDPWYGGNVNYAGWDLLRYPGPRLAVSADDQRLDVPIKPLRASARGRS